MQWKIILERVTHLWSPLWCSDSLRMNKYTQTSPKKLFSILNLLCNYMKDPQSGSKTSSLKDFKSHSWVHVCSAVSVSVQPQTASKHAFILMWSSIMAIKKAIFQNPFHSTFRMWQQQIPHTVTHIQEIYIIQYIWYAVWALGWIPSCLQNCLNSL